MSSAETTPPPTSGPGETSTPVTSPPDTTEPPPPSTTTTPPSTTSTPTTSSPSDTSSSSSSPPPSQTPTTSSPTSAVVTSVVSVSTNSKGEITTIIQASTVSAPTSTTTTTTSSKSNTGAIVGGVVGGVALLVVITALLVWYLRKRRREKEFDAFDGNFDPSKFVANSGGGTLPDIDLDEAPPGAPPADDGMGGRLAGTEIGGGVVTPYPYGSSPYGQPHPEMTQHNMGRTGSPPLSATTAGYYPPQAHNQYPDYAPGTPHSTSTGGGYAQSTPTNPHFMPLPMPVPHAPHTPPPQSVSSSGGYPGGGGYVPGSKEREAFGGRHIMNPDESQQPRPNSTYSQEAHQNYLAHGPSMTTSGSSGNPYLAASSSAGAPGSGVLVHTDGGRLPEEPEGSGGDEIPPTYDSIPGNEQRERPREKA